MKIICYNNAAIDGATAFKSKYENDNNTDTALVFCLSATDKTIQDVKAENQVSKVIIYNVEQFGSPYFNEKYIKLLNECDEIWDYDEKNIEYLKTITKKPIYLHLVPVLPKFIECSEITKDIDVLFYGCINSRREKIINELIAAKLNVIVINNGIYGDNLNNYICRAKCALNIHYYTSNIQEQFRLCRLINNCHIISEKSTINYYNVEEYEYSELTNAVINYIDKFNKTNK